MAKKALSVMMATFFVGALVLIGNTANAQEGKMEGKHKMGMMRVGMKGEHHERGMHGCRMMEGEHHQEGMRGRGMMEGEHQEGHAFFLGMKDELGLSDQQVSQLRALKSETEKQAIRTRADLEILEIELHDLLSQDNVNVKAVDAKIEKMGELQTKMHKAHIHARLDAQKILTPEQRKKLREMHGKRKHGEHMRGKDMD